MLAILTADELAAITGHKQRELQRKWLNANRWVYTVNAAGGIVVGRWYADQKLAGISPAGRGPSINLEAVR